MKLKLTVFNGETLALIPQTILDHSQTERTLSQRRPSETVTVEFCTTPSLEEW